jgi:hypothetical protein
MNSNTTSGTSPMLNDQTLCALLVREEAMSAVQVANAFDVDLVDARDALNALVAVGDMVSASAISPKGAPTIMYSLSNSFKKSKDYHVSVTVLDALPVPCAAPEPVVAPPAKGVAANRVAGGRTERAVAFILERGRATDAELRAELGLKPSEYPSTCLSMPAMQGRVVREGRDWLPGTGIPPKSITRQPAFGGALALPNSTPVAARPSPAFRAAAKASPAPSDAPAAFRCALWSDGVVELQRGGVRLAELRPDEAQAVADLVRDLVGRVV